MGKQVKQIPLTGADCLKAVVGQRIKQVYSWREPDGTDSLLMVFVSLDCLLIRSESALFLDVAELPEEVVEAALNRMGEGKNVNAAEYDRHGDERKKVREAFLTL